MNPSSKPKKLSIELPGHRRLTNAIRAFSRRERFAFSILVLLLLVSTAGLLWQVNRAYMVEIPAHGGSLTEGVIGIPRFINPVLASSDADRDLTALIYSGLMRVSQKGLIPDLAQGYTVSDNGLVYTFTLKSGLMWQDGTPVTADDVIFTISKAQDPSIHSPRRANWEGVKAEKVDDRTVTFTLSQAYAPFLENTTMGIIPKHIWGNVTADQFTFSTYNTQPIGTGPFEIKSISRTQDTPTYYDLTPFSHFALGKPYLDNIRFRFYTDEEGLVSALTSHEVDSINSISPEDATALVTKGYRVERVPLPRVFGVFFNQNQANIFTDKAVRSALDEAIDKQGLIDQVLAGYGTLINGPIPPGTLGWTSPVVGTTTLAEHIKAAQTMLKADGWVIAGTSTSTPDVFTKTTKKGTDTLSFTLSTSAIPELKAVADILKSDWAALGAQVDVKVFNTETLNQTVIRPRDYDALLFGEIIGRDSDPFAFWHSSQRLDPGLNISLYANSSADKLLEKARTTSDPAEREKIYQQFAEIVKKDIPASFLYSPDFIYVIPENLQSADSPSITIPSERFSNVFKWHTNTQYVWKFLSPSTQ